MDSRIINKFGPTIKFILQEEKMNRREMKRLDTRIQTIKKAAQELKGLSEGIPAIDQNVNRILASVKMLEINITDILDLRF